jgi:ketosteroid isomerase-like protein
MRPLLALTLILFTFTTRSEAAPGNEADAVREQVAAYARSVNAADTTLAATVWSTTPDVTFIHPLGHERGWAAIKTNVYEKLMGGLFSERKLTVRDLSVNVHGDVAWAEFYWDFIATRRKDGSTFTNQGRETQVFRRAGGRWQLVHVHYSTMPPASSP